MKTEPRIRIILGIVAVMLILFVAGTQHFRAMQEPKAPTAEAATPRERDHAAGSEWASFGEPGTPHLPSRTVAISASDTAFTPGEVHVRFGETIRFVVTNNGTIRHEFVIGDQAFHRQHVREMEQMPAMRMDEANAIDLEPGQTKILIWRFTRPSRELQFACDIPGHGEAGMVGQLHVEQPNP